MKRDDWKLGSGIKAGDEALVECKVKKVRGWGPPGQEEEGNVLIEINGVEVWVMGNLLKPMIRFQTLEGYNTDS
jgi:hypothetical protein